MVLVAAGRGGDSAAKESAQAAWGELMTRDLDRIRGLVATWRMPGSGDVVIAPGKREDAVGDVFVRIFRMLRTLTGSTIGEYRAAMRTAVDYECRDFAIREMKREQRERGSIDEPASTDDPEGGGRRYDAEVARQSVERDLARAVGDELLATTRSEIDRLPNEDMKNVVRLTLIGLTTREIAAELALGENNVDQLRSRARKLMRPEVFPDADAR